MSFVKFSRGLISVYNSLTRKDPNTLYLVYEDKDSSSGKLYLGDKLISGVDNSSNVSLNNLISNIPQDGMLLQYNATTTEQPGQGHWEAVSIPEALNNLPEYRDRIFIESSLDNILNPKEKDLAIIDNDVFIFIEDEWKKLTDSDLQDRLSNLESQIQANSEYLLSETDKAKLEGLDLDDNNQTIIHVSQVGGLNKEFIKENSFIKSTQPGVLNVTDEGELQLVGVPSTLLLDYIPKSLYQREVGDLSRLEINNQKTNLVQEILNIKESIVWQNLITELNNN